MSHLRSVAVALIALAFSSGLATSATLDLPDPEACRESQELQSVGEPEWTPCERWVWVCIRQGKEANLFVKECLVPRTDAAAAPRKKFGYAPFYNPERYKDTNSLSAAFLYEILTKKNYSEAIPPVGVRITGAYFADTINLENVTTDENLVLDQSIFKDGLRFTNFRTENNLSLDGSNVRGKILLLRAHIGGTLFMEDGVYDHLNATDARIRGSLDAPGSIFNAPVRLDRVSVEGKVSFVRTRLTELTAWDTTIGSKLELRYADVRGRIDLTGTTVNGDLRMQRVTFGRALDNDEKLRCDWSLEDLDAKRFVFSPDRSEFIGHADAYKAIVEEAVRSRPVDQRPEYPCLKMRDEQRDEGRVHHHEVLLRDMKIGGALCLIEITGSIQNPPESAASAPPRHVTAIYLDGTHAQSTILRWSESDSETLWQAVHFTTKNLFIDLNSQPKRHFIDNLNIEHISFIKPGALDQPEEQYEESRAYLCDIRPGPGAHEASDSPETHKHIIKFFTSAENESKSAQPFSEVVNRLNDSNASSVSLNMALSEFKLGKVCSSSNFFRGKSKTDPTRTQAMNGASSVKRWFDRLMTNLSGFDIDETRNIVLDSACFAGTAVYKYSVGYGHQPHNILLLITGFVLLFRVLLFFDKPTPGVGELGRPHHLGLLYSIDMFTPFVKLNPHHVGLTPNRRALRAYLLLHRVIGLVVTSFLVLGIVTVKF